MKILVTGGTGMVGSAFKTVSTNHELILVGSKDFNLTNLNEANDMLSSHQPDRIIHLAARVGGIKGNTDYVADFFYENILINSNVLHAAHTNKINKVVSLLSTCIYPDKSEYPLTEDQIHEGPPHLSNFGYAYAKRMIDVQSRAYRQQHGCNFVTAVPNNLYGPHDNFDLENGHVIPAIIRKIWEAKIGLIEKPIFWGDGSPLREFTYSGDLANILIYILENYNEPGPINIGKTSEYRIAKIVNKICRFLEYTEPIHWDVTKPMGQLRKPSSNKKLLDLGWSRQDYTSIDSGLQKTCEWFAKNYPNVRGV